MGSDGEGSGVISLRGLGLVLGLFRGLIADERFKWWNGWNWWCIWCIWCIWWVINVMDRARMHFVLANSVLIFGSGFIVRFFVHFWRNSNIITISITKWGWGWGWTKIKIWTKPIWRGTVIIRSVWQWWIIRWITLWKEGIISVIQPKKLFKVINWFMIPINNEGLIGNWGDAGVRKIRCGIIIAIIIIVWTIQMHNLGILFLNFCFFILIIYKT